ncbi:hypothetical protein SAMN05216316_0050 [Nitrosovibrio sp. Nv6]|nr:hypothetical protein SAMN05216316_0050 [Nitrosovibrio sp. Nv6]
MTIVSTHGLINPRTGSENLYHNRIDGRNDHIGYARNARKYFENRFSCLPFVPTLKLR